MMEANNNGEKLTLNVLEKWVEEFFQNYDIKVSDNKYPLLYGTYNAKEDEKNDRFANYYRTYWKDTTPELRSAKQTLSEQSKEGRKQIYIGTGRVMAHFQENLEPNDFKYAKDELLSWIAGRAKFKRGTNIYGFCVVKKIDEVDQLIELADNKARRLLKRVDRLRFEWLIKQEKLTVVKNCINAKDNKVALKFVPKRLHKVKGEDGEEYLEFREEWSSEKQTEGSVSRPGEVDNKVFSSKQKPHADVVYGRYFELRDPDNKDLKRKKACEKLIDELKKSEWEPMEYGLNDFQNFYQNANNWQTRKLKNKN